MRSIKSSSSIQDEIVYYHIVILIDSRASNSYITPNFVKRSHLKRIKYEKSWVSQLAIGTKRKTNGIFKTCPLHMDGLIIVVDLNIISLGS